MAKKREILKFKDWLDENPTLTCKTVRNYISHVRNIPLGKISNALSRDAVEEKDKEQVNYVNKILNNLKSKDSDDSEKFVDTVVTLVEEGDLIYARTIVDVVCDAVAKVKAKEEFKNTNLVKKYPALKIFREYLRKKHDYGDSVTSSVVGNDDFDKKSITKGKLSKIDSFDGLILELERERNGESDFIKFAVEQSFFFGPKIVDKRLDEVVKLFNEEQRQSVEKLEEISMGTKLLFARKTEDDSKKKGEYKSIVKSIDPKNKKAKYRKVGFFVDKDKNIRIPVEIDVDGNNEVRRLINEYTGFTIGQGKNSIFQNYIISHLWGNAYDPRYFTNFWNIAIVPAWVNSLLDKEEDNDDSDNLINKLKATFKNIAIDLYRLSEKNDYWKILQMDEPKLTCSTSGVDYTSYKIKILREKGTDVLGIISSRHQL